MVVVQDTPFQAVELTDPILEVEVLWSVELVRRIDNLLPSKEAFLVLLRSKRQLLVDKARFSDRFFVVGRSTKFKIRPDISRKYF